VLWVDPAYTSQCCSRCGNVCRENRKTQSQFECVGCGFKLNADLNAARNIARIAQSQLPDATGVASGRTVTAPSDVPSLPREPRQQLMLLDTSGHCLGASPRSSDVGQ
jgi:transposase